MRKPGAYTVIKAMMDALARKGIPGPDEKLKTIVGAQITALIKGGYDFDLIRHFAVELALSWDNAEGHQRLLGLRQTVLQDVADREYAEHDARKRAGNEPLTADPVVAIAILNAAKRSMRGREEPRNGWSVRCMSAGCDRTALYASAACSDHASSVATAT